MVTSLRVSAVLLVAVIVLSPGTPSAYAQVTFQVGGGLGIVRPAGDYGGSTIDYYHGTKYGLSDGLSLHGKLRLGLIGFTLVGEIDYSSLSNSGNSEPGRGFVEVSQNIFSLKVGPEIQLNVPVLPVTPYVGANVAVHQFSGETHFQGVAKVPSATYSVQSAGRVGIGFGAGAILKLNPLLSLDIGVHYQLMNLLSRTWEDVNPLLDRRLDSYLALNDEKDPAFVPGSDTHFIANARSINSILLTVSVLFGL